MFVPFFPFLRSCGSRGRVTFDDEVESVISTARLPNAGGLAAGFESRRFVMQCLSTVSEQAVVYLAGHCFLWNYLRQFRLYRGNCEEKDG